MPLSYGAAHLAPGYLVPIAGLAAQTVAGLPQPDKPAVLRQPSSCLRPPGIRLKSQSPKFEAKVYLHLEGSS